MPSEMVEIRVVAPSPEALWAAIERLRAVGAELMGELWKDEQGDWQVYAALSAEADLAGVEADLDAAQHVLAEVQTQRDAALARAEELAAQLSSAQEQLQARQVQAEAEKARADVLERQVAQQAEELGELEALRRQVAQLQAQLGQRGQQ